MTPLTLPPARVQQLYDQFLDDAKDFILAHQEMETSALLEGAKKYALGRAVERCAEVAEQMLGNASGRAAGDEIARKIRGEE